MYDTLRPAKVANQKLEWNNDRAIVTYLGTVATGGEIHHAVDRMMTVYQWLRNDRLHVRLLPQERAAHRDVSGHNGGFVLSPRTFALFPY